MKRMGFTILLGFVLTACVQAADWPMFRKDIGRTGFAREIAADTLTFKWKYNTGKSIISSPVVYDGVAYIGSRSGTLYAVNIFGDTLGGTLKWQFASPTGGWIDGTPAVWNGVVYVTCGDGKIYALDAKTGTLRWSKTTGGTDYSSPVVKDGILYVGSGYPNKDVYAIDAWTGKTIWTFSTGQYIYSSPAINGSALYIGSNDGKVYSLNLSDGSSRWGYQTGFVTNGGIYFSSPCVSDTLVYLAPGDIDRNIYGIIMKDEPTDKWAYTVPGAGTTYVSSPALAGDTLYIVSGYNNPTLYALRASDGDTLWSRSVGASTGQGYFSSPAVVGNYIYVGGSDGNIYQFDTSGNSRIYNVGDTYSIVSSPCVANGMILFGSLNGYVYAYEAYTIGAISYPLDGGYAGGETISIIGSARGYDFKRYSVAYGYGTNPETWINIVTEITTPVFNVRLADWGVSNLQAGIYSLKLVLERGSIFETSVISVTLDKSYVCTYVLASAGGVVQSIDGTKVVIPPGVLSNDDFIIVSIPLSYPSVDDNSVRATNIVREFKFGNSSTKINSSVTIIIPYKDSDVVGMNEQDLRIYEWNSTKGKWMPVSSSTVHSSENYVSAEVSHFSIFRIMEFVSGSIPLIEASTTYCYPNPARDVNKMTFKSRLGEDAKIVVNIYNVAGELVATLEKDGLAGVNTTIDWDITNIASGVYIYRVEAFPKSGGTSKVVIKKLAIVH